MSFLSLLPLDGGGRAIQEQCPDCGERQAYHWGDIVEVRHNCPKVPGPASPPLSYRANTVEFHNAPWSSEELVEQRDTAEAELRDLRAEYNRQGRVFEAIHAALGTR